MITIQFHSITDIITNSSTTIFTYSGASVQACREMIDEIFNILDVDKKCDDVFRLTVLADNYTYEEYLENDDDDDDDEDEDDDEDDDEDEDDDGDSSPVTTKEDLDIEKLMEDIKQGRTEKPDWMTDAEEAEDEMGYTPDTTLHIVAKEPEFEKLGKLVVKFLYSTTNEACNG